MENNNQEKSPGEKIGGEIGQEIGQEIGRNAEEHFKKDKKEEKKKRGRSLLGRRIGYLVSILMAWFFLWIINNFSAWGWQFITEDWGQVVGIVKFSIIFNIIVYALFVLYDRPLFYYLGRLAMDSVGIYVAIRVYQVFPFDFNYLFGGWPWLNGLFPWIIIVGIAGTGIGILVRTGRLFSGRNIYD